MSRDNAFWGSILLVLGALLLASNFGIITFQWNYVWPLLLIAVGAYILIGGSSQSRAGEPTHVSIPLEGATEANIKLEHGAGKINISGAASKNELLSGEFEAMRLHTSRSGSKLKATLSTSVEDTFLAFMPWNWHGNHAWDFSLNPDVPTTLRLESGASENRFDLSQTKVTKLVIETGASSTEVIMPKKAGYTDAKISGGAASFEVEIPKGVAARIRVDSGLGSVDVDEERFPRRGKSYQSEDYETAANQVDLKLEVGVSSVKVY